MEMLMRKFIIGVLSALLLTACSGNSSASIQGWWKLISYNQTPAVPNVETFIEFKDGQLNGNVGCNSFGGDYTVNGDTITFGPVISTMMFCNDPIGEQEKGILAVLQKSATFVMDGNTLSITSEDGNSSIVLERK